MYFTASHRGDFTIPDTCHVLTLFSVFIPAVSSVYYVDNERNVRISGGKEKVGGVSRTRPGSLIPKTVRFSA